MSIDESASHRVLREIRRRGLLLESDQEVPSAIVGERVTGSWWGHKDGLLIFRVLKRLRSDPEVLVTKLVSGKVTLIHRELWPELLAISTSKERWQTKNLSQEANILLRMVEGNGEIRTDVLDWKANRNIGEAEPARRLFP